MSTQIIEDIDNFLQISDKIATSGQPTAEQFIAIKQSGYRLIVNLALLTSNNALLDEQQIVESQGMEYVHIPVLWEKPTIENVTKFINVMEANVDKKVFIHCAANKRVSAFIYLYRRLYTAINEQEAKQDLHKIWIPNEIWNKFIQEMIEINNARLG
ncbi:protein tyrosine phosphatase family protein [Nostocaceae cyanobacterium CENA357]|uniref:Protein tyrosine phosphatase family protein n=1 Tax=Atlanticothrix silvestris CENA357 TaxID=1725252 RepID=A0A8J7HCZ2_9CYAN|nr:protein tyrosine phosphatase family protein [Atlanticothrix silvestris]MBH8553703.1 protein tyrosine phosphatase family protein [Atlanticothrix silvestris CENA357]